MDRREQLKIDLVTSCIKGMPREAEELVSAWETNDLARVKSIVKTFETHIILIEDTIKDQLYEILGK